MTVGLLILAYGGHGRFVADVALDRGYDTIAFLDDDCDAHSRSWIGAGRSVRQGVRIGGNVMVGVGAAVVADIPNAGVYVGVPARAINTHN